MNWLAMVVLWMLRTILGGLLVVLALGLVLPFVTSDESRLRFFSWLDDHTVTIYAPEFSEESFAAIREGMDRSQVVETAGEPLLISGRVCDGKAAAQRRFDGSLVKIFPEEFVEEPCSSSFEHGEIWYYTQQGDSRKDFEMRRVLFSSHGKVVHIESYFFID